MTELKYTDLSEACRYMGCGDEPDETLLALARVLGTTVEGLIL